MNIRALLKPFISLWTSWLSHGSLGRDKYWKDCIVWMFARLRQIYIHLCECMCVCACVRACVCIIVVVVIAATTAVCVCVCVFMCVCTRARACVVTVVVVAAALSLSSVWFCMRVCVRASKASSVWRKWADTCLWEYCSQRLAKQTDTYTELDKHTKNG